MRPSERAANVRRARRRTLFAGPQPGPEPEPDPEPAPAVAAVAVSALGEAPVLAEPLAPAEFALEEFVIDDDDYPEVTFAQRRIAPAASAPDRVDDIDDWLEEFAVADGQDALPY
ncbi:MAG: hypothetical protein ABI658_22780 [Acidimicrobiales bacterium]